jgi:hypothetical protein
MLPCPSLLKSKAVWNNSLKFEQFEKFSPCVVSCIPSCVISFRYPIISAPIAIIAIKAAATAIIGFFDDCREVKALCVVELVL